MQGAPRTQRACHSHVLQWPKCVIAPRHTLTNPRCLILVDLNARCWLPQLRHNDSTESKHQSRIYCAYVCHKSGHHLAQGFPPFVFRRRTIVYPRGQHIFVDRTIWLRRKPVHVVRIASDNYRNRTVPIRSQGFCVSAIWEWTERKWVKRAQSMIILVCMRFVLHFYRGKTVNKAINYYCHENAQFTLVALTAPRWERKNWWAFAVATSFNYKLEIQLWNWCANVRNV